MAKLTFNDLVWRAINCLIRNGKTITARNYEKSRSSRDLDVYSLSNDFTTPFDVATDAIPPMNVTPQDVNNIIDACTKGDSCTVGDDEWTVINVKHSNTYSSVTLVAVRQNERVKYTKTLEINVSFPDPVIWTIYGSLDAHLDCTIEENHLTVKGEEWEALWFDLPPVE